VQQRFNPLAAGDTRRVNIASHALQRGVPKCLSCLRLVLFETDCDLITMVKPQSLPAYRTVCVRSAHDHSPAQDKHFNHETLIT